MQTVSEVATSSGELTSAPEVADDAVPWRLRAGDAAAAVELGKAVGVSAALGQLLLQRGITSASAAQAYLYPRLASLTPPQGMADREVAAERLARAVRARERIVVFGDYDVDGTTAAAVLADVLESLGADVVACVAQRFQGGYGFSDEALARVMELRPGVIVTCDCGSSDHPRIEQAMRRGVDVLVIDHHLVPEEALPALAFINPHRAECPFPYTGMASAGLVFSVGAAVRSVLGVELDLRPWLDLVALGTLADQAPLDGDNRLLVRAGLERLGQPGGRPGLQALCEQAKIKPGCAVGGGDVAFRLAPRLNAPGRLGDQDLTLRLLRSRNLVEARALAASVEAINEERKRIQQSMAEEAIAQVLEVYGAEPRSGVVVASERWHRGVVGIVAARLVDRFGVPAVVVAFDGSSGHGSGRAPRGFRLFDAIEPCRPELERAGGHQAAVGLGVRAERLERFRQVFADATQQATPGTLQTMWADIALDGVAFQAPPASELHLLEPMGQGNVEPTFVLPDVELVRPRTVGSGHLKVGLRSAGQTLGAFGFDMGKGGWTDGCRVTALGSLQPDTWRGGENVELRLRALWRV